MQAFSINSGSGQGSEWRRMQVAPIRALLEMRERWAGPGASLTPNRFLYETVGELHYIRWSAKEGHKVRCWSYHFSTPTPPPFSHLRAQSSSPQAPFDDAMIDLYDGHGSVLSNANGLHV
jgi:hypothetical protein